jgi:hypothetical protein
MKKTTIRVIGLILLLAVPPAARADITDCTEITSVPFFIHASGVYCLKRSLRTSIVADGIHIRADDVVVDLNGHVLENSAGSVGGQSGIRAVDSSNVVVRNGTVRGFFAGVFFQSLGRGNVVEGMRLEHNIAYGVNSQGPGAIVRNNVVLGTGPGVSSHVTTGLQIDKGDFAVVTGNQVLHTIGNPNSNFQRLEGISVINSVGALIARNVVSGQPGSDVSSGIVLLVGGRNSVIGNRIVNMRTGISIGSEQPSVYHSNVVGGATTPFLIGRGVTTAGGANFTF